MNVFTIGFTKKTAEIFFNLLRDNQVQTLIDVRLNNWSQLAGFAKSTDLKFFLRELCQADYIHAIDLAPTKDILDGYKDKSIAWDEYSKKFIDLLTSRKAEYVLSKEQLEQSCFLCSESKPDHCHRRLVVEYLMEHSGFQIKVKHL